MGLLDEIIGGASSEGTTTANLLRKVMSLAHRIDAADLQQWARAELLGYSKDAALPEYRGPFVTPVEGVYSGPFDSGGTNMVSPAGVADEHIDLFQVGWRVSIVEIEALSHTEGDVSQPWDPHWVGLYNQWISAGRVPRVRGMALYSARKLISTAMLKSIVESVRTYALELALDLQAANPAAGEVNGPTVADTQILSAVTNNTWNVFGEGANIAQGASITQTSGLASGDLTGLIQALQELIGDAAKVREAVAVITSEESAPKKESRLRAIGAALASGAGTVVGGVTADVASDRLLELARQYLGW